MDPKTLADARNALLRGEATDLASFAPGEPSPLYPVPRFSDKIRDFMLSLGYTAQAVHSFQERIDAQAQGFDTFLRAQSPAGAHADAQRRYVERLGSDEVRERNREYKRLSRERAKGSQVAASREKKSRKSRS